MIKFALASLAVLSLLAIAAVATVISWTRTPYGRLTVPAAVLSRLSAWQEAKPVESIEAMRASRREAMRLITAAPEPVAAVRDERIPGPGGDMAVRIYNPSAASTALPLIVYYHGGGWVLGDLDSHDNVCRTLALRANAVVVAVDYRLAPEHPYPAAVDDAWAALGWAAAQATHLGADPGRIAVAGDSAGGNLAAVMALMAREQGGPALRAQVLIYPGVDMITNDRPSLVDFADGLFLTHERIEWFKDQYVPDRTRRGEPNNSPLLAADHRGLPPAIIVTAQFDPLRDEGEAYGEVLRAAGVPVLARRVDGVIHGYVSMDRWFPEARESLGWIGEALTRQL